MLKQLTLILSILISTQAISALRIATYNIRNFDYDSRSNTPTNKTYMIKQLQNLDSDLIAVQEINDTITFANIVEESLPGYKVVLSECGGSHQQRLGFIYNTRVFSLNSFKQDLSVANPFNSQQQAGSCSGSRPLGIGNFTIKSNGENLIAISLHLKSGGSKRSLEKRFRQLAITKELVLKYKRNGYNNFTLMGDFNSTEYIHNGKWANKFRTFVSNAGLVDLSENLKCTAYWWGAKQDDHQYPSKLDHILVSPSLTTNKTQAYLLGHCQKLQCQVTHDSNMGISYDEVSDHCPTAADL